MLRPFKDDWRLEPLSLEKEIWRHIAWPAGVAGDRSRREYCEGAGKGRVRGEFSTSSPSYSNPHLLRIFIVGKT